MKTLLQIVLISCLVLTVASCRKEETLNLTPPVDLGGETWSPTALDKWLLDSLTTPYNIAVKYRWDPWELNLDKTLTPPDESKIIPAMSAIKRVWIDPYTAETGSDLFIKQYSPKQFKLVGSVEYNYNNTVVLGQAEGGNSIAFFDVNQNFDRNPVTSIRRMIQTSHHEFAHILHQTVLYPPEFKGISSNLGLDGYTATWFNVSETDALANGYITPYSMASFDEDFVEMVANMLVEGRSRFEELVASVNPTAQQAFRSKERIVVTYFREVWKIDFYSLQTRVQAALNALAPPPAIQQAFGPGKDFTIADVDPDDQVLLAQRPYFQGLVNQARANLAARFKDTLSLDSFALVTPMAQQSVLRMYLKASGGDVVLGDFTLATTRPGGNYDFTVTSRSFFAELAKNEVAPLVDYFENGVFSVAWQSDPSTAYYPRIRFTPDGSVSNSFVARLYR